MEFQWDSGKATRNLAKHGVSFPEASTVFGDVLSMTYPDPDHSDMEERWITIGVSSQGRMLIVAHMDQDERIRIISAREATRAERRFYEEQA
jgi:uncharacterized DUF497 family protein